MASSPVLHLLDRLGVAIRGSVILNRIRLQHQFLVRLVVLADWTSSSRRVKTILRQDTLRGRLNLLLGEQCAGFGRHGMGALLNSVLLVWNDLTCVEDLVQDLVQRLLARKVLVV